MKIIDFHTHAFPDAVAEKAIPFLEGEADVKAAHDGKLSSLLSSMDRAGIQSAVVCSIATKPSQFLPILEWSKQIASSRIIPLASVHPDDPSLAENVGKVKEAGLQGLKMHPYYQRFVFNEKRMLFFYEAVRDNGLLLVSHTGFDIAYPRDRIVDPEKILSILTQFPDLKFVATHLGSWEDWDEVEKHLLGKEIYLEISYTLGILDDDRFVSMVLRHPPEFLLFGTDSPWDDQKRALGHFLALKLPESLKEKMLETNARRLLQL